MGGGSWSNDAYDDRARVRAATNTPVFAYDNLIATGKTASKVHDDMDPKRVAGPASAFAGKVMRESCDSDAHPESLAIGVGFDVTGSMGSVPRVLQTKLAGLMTLLIQKGYVAHPQILFAAIGDANSDVAPLQIGQFESGLEMEDDLAKFYLEGNGGGQIHETYELLHYFFANHTAIDCWTKRSHKGYLFTIGDEAPYATIRPAQVEQLIGDTVKTLQTADVFADVMTRYHVFHIHAQQGSYRDLPAVLDPWKELLGERVLKLEDADNVAELIGLTIGLTEGTIDLDAGASHLKGIGVSAAGIKTVTTALAPYAAKYAVVKANVTGDLPVVAAPAGAGVQRL